MGKKNTTKPKRFKRKHSYKGTLVVFLVMMVGLALIYFLPQFYIKNINVTGLRVLTNEKIILAGELKTGVHIFSGVKGNISDIFSLRHPEIEKNLTNNLSFIKRVSVRSVFPSILDVAIEERIEVAYISIEDGFLIIDADTVALEVFPKDSKLKIPIIEGVVIYDYQLGQIVKVDKATYLNKAAYLLNAIFETDMDTRVKIKLLESIESIRPVGEDIFFLKIRLPNDKTLNVKAANSYSFQEDALWIRFALEQGKLNDLGKGYLDLTTSQKVFIPED